MFVPQESDGFTRVARGGVFALLLAAATWRDTSGGGFLGMTFETKEGASASSKFFVNRPGPLPELTEEERADKKGEAMKAYNRQKAANGGFRDFLVNIGVTPADFKDLNAGKAILVLDKDNLTDEEAADIANATTKPRIISVVGSRTFGVVATPEDVGGGEKYTSVIKIGKDQKLLEGDVAAAGGVAQLCRNLGIKGSSGGGRRATPQEAGDDGDGEGSQY